MVFPALQTVIARRAARARSSPVCFPTPIRVLCKVSCTTVCNGNIRVYCCYCCTTTLFCTTRSCRRVSSGLKHSFILLYVFDCSRGEMPQSRYHNVRSMATAFQKGPAILIGAPVTGSLVNVEHSEGVSYLVWQWPTRAGLRNCCNTSFPTPARSANRAGSVQCAMLFRGKPAAYLTCKSGWCRRRRHTVASHSLHHIQNQPGKNLQSGTYSGCSPQKSKSTVLSTADLYAAFEMSSLGAIFAAAPPAMARTRSRLVMVEQPNGAKRA